MSVLATSENRVIVQDYHDEESDILGSICRNSDEGDAGSAGATTMEAEKRIRREIANSNERRRMQSINAGFQSLRSLLPHHEGEKLSKAAILQQTAEYIYNLEQEKTRLLSQNCQLMRQVHQHEVGDIPPKKRKTEIIISSVPTVSESSDEGLGSMSPEPVGLVIANPVPPPQPQPASVQTQNTTTSSSSSEILELRRQLEHERTMRTHLEEQLRNMESQIYQQYQQQEVIEHADGLRGETLVTVIHDPEDIEMDMQLVTAENLPPVAQTQTVVCSPQLSRSPSPVRVPSPLPTTEPPRLPSALEAAIKAEPKVEVERLPSPATPHDDVSCGRIYVANTSRQNLETIVEAIRHLEGDHLFSDEPTIKQHTLPQQEVPLALTNKPPTQERMLKVEMNPYLQFHTTSVVQQQQQSRPGVIVVKQHS